MTERLPPAAAAEVQTETSDLGLPTPTPPKPTAFGQVPPQNSGYETWATSTTATLFWWWDADHHDWHAWIPLPPDNSGYVVSSDTSHIPARRSMVMQWWGTLPAYTVTRRVYWNQTDCQFLAAGSGAYVQRSWSTPESPVNTAFVLWQLVEEYAALLADGSVLPVPPRGTWDVRLSADVGTADGAAWIPTPRVAQPMPKYYLDITRFP